ncbi:MAG: hypothetical protein ACRYF5_10130, partial [Janthinobacterium lividum]
MPAHIPALRRQNLGNRLTWPVVAGARPGPGAITLQAPANICTARKPMLAAAALTVMPQAIS